MASRKAIEQAINEGKQMRIHYTDNSGSKQEFLLEPNYIFWYHKKLYIVAYNCTYDDVRVFRLSRINSYRVLKSSSTHYPLPFSSANLGNYFVVKDIVVITSPRRANGDSEKFFSTSKESAKSQYPKQIWLGKMVQSGMCRSPLEEKVLKELNHDPSVRSLTIEPFSIPYHFEGEERKYVPDVMIEYNDGRVDIVEIKLSGEISDPKNQAKFRAAKTWCQNKGYIFKIMGIEAKGSNYIGGSPQWTAKQERALIQVFDSKYDNGNDYNISIEPNPRQSDKVWHKKWLWWMTVGVIILLVIFNLRK